MYLGLYMRFLEYAQTQYSRDDFPGRVISPTHGLSQETDIHAAGGVRTRNPCKWVTAESHLRPRGHRDRRFFKYWFKIIKKLLELLVQLFT
jgi:hypothetical protein